MSTATATSYFFSNLSESAMTTSTKEFREKSRIHGDGSQWNPIRHLVSFYNFIKFLPQMKGEWNVECGVTNIETREFSHTEYLGKGISWENLCEENIYIGYEFCYVKATSSTGEIILCQMYG
jgi:hypothetical protein